MRSAVSPVRPEEEPQMSVTGPRWKVGSVPPGSGPREIDTALLEAARPFMDDGYRSTARVGDAVQLARPRRTWLPGRIIAGIGWLGAALLGFLFPIYLTPGWSPTDPVYLWVDPSGDIYAVREQVLRPIEYRA
jgi:hypothetical protein